MFNITWFTAHGLETADVGNVPIHFFKREFSKIKKKKINSITPFKGFT